MDREPIATGRLPALGECRVSISRSIGVDLPIPQKPTLARGRGGRRRSRWHLGYLTECQGGSGGSGWSRGSAAAWGPPLRWQTRRLEVIRRPLPGNVSALLPRRISGLVRLYLLQHGRQPLVVDIAPGCTVWILSNTLKPSVAPLN